MGIEIERKFLVHGEEWRGAVIHTIPMIQGYVARADIPSTGMTGMDAVHTGQSAQESDHPGVLVVRVRRAGDEGYLTLKGPSLGGEADSLIRAEFEYPIPAADADAMIAAWVDGVVEKTRFVLDPDRFDDDADHTQRLSGLGGDPTCHATRHSTQHSPWQWTVDVFHGVNDGLVVLEIEGTGVETLSRDALPQWVGDEVSADVRFTNAALALTPYSQFTR